MMSLCGEDDGHALGARLAEEREAESCLRRLSDSDSETPRNLYFCLAHIFFLKMIANPINRIESVDNARFPDHSSTDLLLFPTGRPTRC
jgi:hypothetical protein